MHRICKNSGDETIILNICKVVAGGTKPISSIIYYALKVKNVFTVSMGFRIVANMMHCLGY
jgi:hypothetical protein